MKELHGDIWDFHAKGRYICITTNGSINKLGRAVMGRGVAREAAIRFPELPNQLGRTIQNYGNHTNVFPEYRVICLPVKHQWHQTADMDLIKRSCQEMVQGLRMWGFKAEEEFALVRPGCGNGNLNWSDVKPMLEKILDDRFLVVERNI